MKRFVRRFLLIAVAILIVAAVTYAFVFKTVAVDVASVVRGPLRVTIDEDGKTRIKERYVVSTPLAGRLLRIELKPGDAVSAGSTVLSRIEPTDPALLDPRARAEAVARVSAAEAKRKQAGADFEKAVAAMQYTESGLARVRRLVEQKAASRDELDAAELANRLRAEEFKSSKFAEEIARFELELTQAALLRTQPETEPGSHDWHFQIQSPITGRVLRVFQESATVVAAGAPLVELGDPADLEVVIDVISSDAVKIPAGAKVLLEEWGGDEPLGGRVRLVEPSGFTKISALGVEEQRVNVIVDFNDPFDKRPSLGDGFRVEARIVVWDRPNVLKVPVGALFRHQNQWAVFRIIAGRASLQPIQLGHRNGLEAEVLDGLTEGDQLIVHPSDSVQNGVAVEPRPGAGG